MYLALVQTQCVHLLWRRFLKSTRLLIKNTSNLNWRFDKRLSHNIDTEFTTYCDDDSFDSQSNENTTAKVLPRTAKEKARRGTNHKRFDVCKNHISQC